MGGGEEVPKILQVAELRPKAGLQDAMPGLVSCTPNCTALREAERGSLPRVEEGERISSQRGRGGENKGCKPPWMLPRRRLRVCLRRRMETCILYMSVGMMLAVALGGFL